MPRPPLTLFSTLLAALFFLAACSPTFNWREVRPENTRLSLLLPCKPDKAQKTVPLGGQTAQLSMLGCDAGGATFAVAVADMGDAAHTGAALAQWQSLTLANMKAGPVGTGAGATQVLPFKAPGLAPGLQAVLVKAQGQRADGSAVSGQAVYFVQGAQVFQVVLYASQVSPEVAETYFASLRLQAAP